MDKYVSTILCGWPIAYYFYYAINNEKNHNGYISDLLWSLILFPYLTAPYLFILFGIIFSRKEKIEYILLYSFFVAVLFFIYLKFDYIPFPNTISFTIFSLILWLVAIFIFISIAHNSKRKSYPNQNSN